MVSLMVVKPYHSGRAQGPLLPGVFRGCFSVSFSEFCEHAFGLDGGVVVVNHQMSPNVLEVPAAPSNGAVHLLPHSFRAGLLP